MFHGSIVALVTPMKTNGAVDMDSLHRLLDWHAENLTDGIVILGTTGESPTIDFKEREQIIRKTVEWLRGDAPIIVGTGVNSTRETIHLTSHAMELGADACLVVTPYYNKPTQEGLYQHFKAVAEAVAIPQILYNVPSRTGCDLMPETIGRLSNIPNIVGVKEATGDISRVATILDQCVNSIDILSGDDATALELMIAGGKGVISVTANVAPREMHDMCAAVLSGDEEKAKQLNEKLMPLHKQLFVESNPIPTKWVLHEMGMIPPGIRLPLTVLSENKHAIVRQALQTVGVMNSL